VRITSTSTSTSTTSVNAEPDLLRTSLKAVAEGVLVHRHGVPEVAVNPVNMVGQTAPVTYMPAQTLVATLVGEVPDGGYQREGPSVPRHVGDPGNACSPMRPKWPRSAQPTSGAPAPAGRFPAEAVSQR
jgi:hypothetical protein